MSNLLLNCFRYFVKSGRRRPRWQLSKPLRRAAGTLLDRFHSWTFDPSSTLYFARFPKYRTTLKTYCESGTFARGMERVDPIFYGDPLTVAMKALGMN